MNTNDIDGADVDNIINVDDKSNIPFSSYIGTEFINTVNDNRSGYTRFSKIRYIISSGESTPRNTNDM